MEKFIVAEITKNWVNQISPTVYLLSQQFEKVINVNADRGYKLTDWKLNQLINGDTFTETIIAIFEAKQD